MFLVDLMAFRGDSKHELNDTLTEIFKNPASTILGFSFEDDLLNFRNMNSFVHHAHKFVDLETLIS